MDRVEAWRADLAAAPDRLADLGSAYAGPGTPLRGLADRLDGRRLVFTGLGSSRYAALAGASVLTARGRTAWVEFASVAGSPPPARDLALVAISASGRTAEVVAAARRHRGTSLVIAITNDPDSPLAGTADIVLPLHAGPEAAGISTLTYRATVAVLGLLVGVLPIERLRATPDRLATLDGILGTTVVEAAALLDGAPSIDVLADAGMLGTAEQAALMLREAPRLPARAGETGDWLHSGVYLALPGMRALIVAGAASDEEVAATMTRRGGKAIAIGASIPGAAVTMTTDRRDSDGPFERAILDSTVADRLALALWDRATATEG